MKKYHFSMRGNLRRAFCWGFFLAAFVHASLWPRTTHAQLKEPAVSISMVLSDLFRERTSADRRYGIPFNLFSFIRVDANDPVAAESVDVYVGFIRSDGVSMTWSDLPEPYEFTLPAAGMRPLIRNVPLSNGGFGLPETGGYIRYVFSSEDLPGIYHWFPLLVRAGKPVEDTTQWIGFRTKMLPVK